MHSGSCSLTCPLCRFRGLRFEKPLLGGLAPKRAARPYSLRPRPGGQLRLSATLPLFPKMAAEVDFGDLELFEAFDPPEESLAKPVHSRFKDDGGDAEGNAAGDAALRERLRQCEDTVERLRAENILPARRALSPGRAVGAVPGRARAEMARGPGFEARSLAPQAAWEPWPRGLGADLPRDPCPRLSPHLPPPAGGRRGGYSGGFGSPIVGSGFRLCSRAGRGARTPGGVGFWERPETCLRRRCVSLSGAEGGGPRMYSRGGL